MFRACIIVTALLAAGFAVLLVLPAPKFQFVAHKNAGDWSGGRRTGATDSDSGAKVVPFTAHVDESVLEDLQMRLNNAKLPPMNPVSNMYGDKTWFAGVNTQALHEATAYWRDEFDWRAVEDELNQFAQFTTFLRGLNIHFIHHLGQQAGTDGKRCTVRPLLLLHGWPGSVLEFMHLIPKLGACTENGGVALTVVAPCMPGYGFSDPPLVEGMSPDQIASLYVELMQVLGHDKFYVQGGDWGGMVGRNVAMIAPEHVLGYHANFMPFFPPPAWGILAAIFPSWILGPDADQYAPVSNLFAHVLDHSGYFHEQSTRPNTIGAALSASPISLLAWHLEKFFMWTDADESNFADKHPISELLPHIAIYWMTDSMTTSMRLYYEFMHSPGFFEGGAAAVDVPVAYADFPHEITRTPEFFMGLVASDLVQYTRMPRGGHFAAVEEPQLLADDVKSFIAKVEARN